MMLRRKDPQEIACDTRCSCFEVRALPIENRPDHLLLKPRSGCGVYSDADSEGRSMLPRQIQLRKGIATQPTSCVNHTAELQPRCLQGTASRSQHLRLPPGVERLPILQPRQDRDALRREGRVGGGGELTLLKFNEVRRAAILCEHRGLGIGGHRVGKQADAEIVAKQVNSVSLRSFASAEYTVSQQCPSREACLPWPDALFQFISQALHETCQLVGLGKARVEPTGVEPVCASNELAKHGRLVEVSDVGTGIVVEEPSGKVLAQRLDIELECSLYLAGQRPDAIRNRREQGVNQAGVLFHAEEVVKDRLPQAFVGIWPFDPVASARDWRCHPR